MKKTLLTLFISALIFSSCNETSTEKGADPNQEYDVIGVKSGMHFRAFYENFTDKLLLADVPRTTSRDITLFEHTRLKYPIYPLDKNATFNLRG